MTANSVVDFTEDLPEIPVAEAQKAIIDSVLPRLWVRSGQTEPCLALEVLYGPYKGVVFLFSKFEVGVGKLDNGMVPTKFETEIFVRPEGFREDAAWDEWSSELLLAWLNYIAMHDFGPIIRARTRGIQ